MTYYWSGGHESQCTVVRLNGFMTDRTDVWFIEWFWTRRNKSAERPRTVTWLDNRSMTNRRDFRIRRFPGIEGLDSFQYLLYLSGMFYRLSDFDRWSPWDCKIIYHFYDFECQYSASTDRRTNGICVATYTKWIIYGLILIHYCLTE